MPIYFVKENCSDDGYRKNEAGERSYQNYKQACGLVENKDCHLKLTESEAFDRAEKYGRCAGLRESFQTNCVLPEARDKGHKDAIQNAKNAAGECRRLRKRIRDATITRSKQKNAMLEREKEKKKEEEQLKKTPKVITKKNREKNTVPEKRILTGEEITNLLSEGLKQTSVPTTASRRSRRARGKKSKIERRRARTRRRIDRKRARNRRKKWLNNKISEYNIGGFQFMN